MTDQGTEGILSQFLRRRRLNAAKPYLKGRILDVGCGSGALAEMVSPNRYTGVDLDTDSIISARNKFPDHKFSEKLPDSEEKFDTIVLLAVIEHVKNPKDFLMGLSHWLAESSDAKIVITTPHPKTEWIHNAGASVGLFSKHANKEHGDLLDHQKIDKIGKETGLSLRVYKRFLFGINQLAVYMRNP